MLKNKIVSRQSFIVLFLLPLFFGLHCTGPEKMSQQEFDGFQRAFAVPHDTNVVWCYYYWIGDDISKYGVTKDMEAMKEFGIGAALIGNINPDEVDGPVPLFSDKWWDIMVHAVNEGHRLGIDVGFFNCPGWSQSGGPWVDYDMAMRHLVYSETSLSGPKNADIILEQPADEFQDTYVLAFRTPKGEDVFLSDKNASVHVTPPVSDPHRLIDNDLTTAALFDTGHDGNYTITITADTPLDLRSIVLHPALPQFKCEVELMAWEDGGFRTIRSFTFDRSNLSEQVGPVTHGPLALALPETRSGRFRLRVTELESGAQRAGFSQITLSERAVFQEYIEKTLGKMDPTPFPVHDAYFWDMQEEITDHELIVEEVVDLTDRMDESGRLTWDVPEGRWTVIRTGMTPTGTKNAPAAPQGKGYEIDKMSAELIRYHFEQFMGEIIRRIPEESLPALKYTIADSYEMGSQNWTDDFEVMFEEKFGYDPVKYLPVYSGRIVGSVEESERFLWDMRRAVADDIAYEYVRGLREVSNEHNLKLWLENYGHWGFPAEFLMYGGQSDIVAGEFWNEGRLGDTECKAASSAANIYGQPFTSGEVFTAAWRAYTRHPALLKRRGDWSFTEGINHFVLHLYIQQPDDERIPGINADFSTEFNRHNTWFEQGRHWVDYMRRAQHMLQKGMYVADVLYFIGEDVPRMSGHQDNPLPPGYSYDYVNAEVILTRLDVENGSFILPDGMSYNLLVLPDRETMRPHVLAQIEEFVKKGGTVLGPRPVRSPSLENYPHSDEELKRIAARLWDGDYVDGKLINQHGKGLLLDGMTVQEALDLTGIPKDLDLGDNTDVLWLHRTSPGMEIYFLTNQTDDVVAVDPVFRVEGLKPQLWNGVTGEIRKLNDYTVTEGGTQVPLRFNPLESWYVVFTNHQNEAVSNGYGANFPDAQKLLDVDGTWKVDFHNKEIGPDESLVLNALSDWTDASDHRIKYYSGTATYNTTFTVDEVPGQGDIFINLGDVGVMAEVTLNGAFLGGAWISPFTYAVGDHLKQGENTLEVEVVNVWRNRMIKDLMLPEEERKTWFIAHDIVPGEHPPSAGLLGPVRLEIVR